MEVLHIPCISGEGRLGGGLRHGIVFEFALEKGCRQGLFWGRQCFKAVNVLRIVVPQSYLHVTGDLFKCKNYLYEALTTTCTVYAYQRHTYMYMYMYIPTYMQLKNYNG